jgi:hypothetical protein
MEGEGLTMPRDLLSKSIEHFGVAFEVSSTFSMPELNCL